MLSPQSGKFQCNLAYGLTASAGYNITELEKAGTKLQEKEKAANDASDKATDRIRQAQAAEAAYSELVAKVVSETGSMSQTIEGAVKKVIESLKPKE